MFKLISLPLKRGIKKVADNPQLIYTIVIAILITGSFIFMAERFIGIANNAQERLINVRIGSLQDAFVSFARDKIDDTNYLNLKIQEVKNTNETIKNFKVVAKRTFNDREYGEIPNSYVVIASDDINEVGKLDEKSHLLYSLASTSISRSVTIETFINGERFFETARAIFDDKNNVLGVVITTQTLSMADIAIESNIRNSRILLFFVIFLILFLFLRHSKIIDYMDLYKKLKEVDQLKDDFISMASHELRTPLTIIRGYAEFVGEAKELTSQTKEFVTKIEIASKELDSLVSDLLDVSRIEQGRMQFKLEKINPKDIIEKVVTSLSITAKDKGLNVSFDASKVINEDMINVDPNSLKQILINIVGNAVKYTLKGEVTVKQYSEKNNLVIRVIDTGIGMTEEERKGLFSKFYRIKNKETESIRGTGLGLWITAEMIKQMNGNLSVESIKGVGSHFIISFPITK